MAILGPNGAGKSTLMKTALDLVPPLAGSVTFFGGPLSAARHRRLHATSSGSRLGLSRNGCRRRPHGHLRQARLVTPTRPRRTRTPTKLWNACRLRTLLVSTSLSFPAVKSSAPSSRELLQNNQISYYLTNPLPESVSPPREQSLTCCGSSRARTCDRRRSP